MYNPMTSFCSRQGGRHQSELLDFFTGMCIFSPPTIVGLLADLQLLASLFDYFPLTKKNFSFSQFGDDLFWGLTTSAWHF